MKHRIILSLFLICFVFLLFPTSVFAQEGYTVHLKKNFGYGFGNKIRGTFTVSLLGDEGQVDKVTFLMDGEILAVVENPPFQHKFQTDDYAVGYHQIFAEVQLWNGTLYVTPSLQVNLVSADEERQQIISILSIIFGGIAVTLVIVGLVQGLLLRKRKRPGKPEEYGILGGTICPRCGRPFPRHLLGVNFWVGRLDRCDHCGKWVMTTRASPDALQAAYNAMEKGSERDSFVSEDKDGYDVLEDSKYIDHL